MDPTVVPATGQSSKIRTAAQWIAFLILALFAVIIATELRKASTPGAPVALLCATIASAVLLVVAHLPPVFRRFPPWGKLVAYVAIIAVFILFGTYLQQMERIWAATPAGKKEVADKAERERVEAIERAKDAAREKADREDLAREAADRKRAGLEAQKIGICKSLVDQIIEQTKAGDGPSVIEIDFVIARPSADPENPITCDGTAITSRGKTPIQFGLEHTPQGKDLLSFRFE